MSVQLEIEDGSPWWASPNIWTVPGNDPQGVPGMPIVGEPCYMWARVRNTGSTAVNNAQVHFYWANPSVGFDRNTANSIGFANVSLGANDTKDVLCLTPWMPVFVNNGHECVLAEAYHTTADPLPATPAFNVPTDRHVAQRNLSVVMASKKMMFSFSFQVCNNSRQTRTFRVFAKPGRVAEIRPLLKHIGERTISINDKGEVANLGFVRRPCPDENEIEQTEREVEGFEVAGNACNGLSLVGRLNGEAALVHVVQEVNGQEVGGLSVLVVAQRGGDKEPRVTQTRGRK